MFWAVWVAVFNMLAVTCFIQRFLQLYALHLEADPLVLGVMVFCLQWAALARLPAAARVERRGKKRVLVLEWGLCAPAALLVVLSPELPALLDPVTPDALRPMLEFLHPQHGWAVLGVIVGATAFNILQQGGSTGWFPLLQDVVPAETRGRFFGLLRSTWQLTTKLFLLFGAWYLGTDPETPRYQWLLAIGVAAVVLRVACLTRIPEVPRPPRPAEPFWRQIRIPFADPLYRNYLAFIALFQLATGMFETFTLVYLKELGFGDDVLTLGVAAMSLGAVLSLFGWGRMSDAFGSRPVFGLCVAATAVTALAWFAVRPLAEAGGTDSWAVRGAVLGLFVASGMFVGGFGIAQTRKVMDIVPRDRQAIYFSLNTIATDGALGMGAFAAGLLAAYGADAAAGWLGLGWDVYRWIFLSAAGVMLAALPLNGRIAGGAETPTRRLLTGRR
jgi:MFS family permease